MNYTPYEKVESSMLSELKFSEALDILISLYTPIRPLFHSILLCSYAFRWLKLVSFFRHYHNNYKPGAEFQKISYYYCVTDVRGSN